MAKSEVPSGAVRLSHSPRIGSAMNARLMSASAASAAENTCCHSSLYPAGVRVLGRLGCPHCGQEMASEEICRPQAAQSISDIACYSEAERSEVQKKLALSI